MAMKIFQLEQYEKVFQDPLSSTGTSSKIDTLLISYGMFLNSVSVSGTRVFNLPIRANVFGPPERASATIAHLAR